MVDAVQLYSDGQTARAQAILKTLSVAAPENDGVWYYLALTQTVSQDLDGAEESLRKAVSLDGGNYWYRRMLARLCLMHGKEEEGMALYEALVKDFPDNYYATGRPEEAGKWLKASADTAPESLAQTAAYVQYLSLQKKWCAPAMRFSLPWDARKRP